MRRKASERLREDNGQEKAYKRYCDRGLDENKENREERRKSQLKRDKGYLECWRSAPSRMRQARIRRASLMLFESFEKPKLSNGDERR